MCLGGGRTEWPLGTKMIHIEEREKKNFKFNTLIPTRVLIV